MGHFVTPPGVHGWHWVHILLQKLFYLPILDLRERETSLHSKRVQEYALLLADRMGRKDTGLRESLEMGALLYDVGKIGVPDGVLLKKVGLTAEERDMVRCHPEFGASC